MGCGDCAHTVYGYFSQENGTGGFKFIEGADIITPAPTQASFRMPPLLGLMKWNIGNLTLRPIFLGINSVCTIWVKMESNDKKSQEIRKNYPPPSW